MNHNKKILFIVPLLFFALNNLKAQPAISNKDSLSIVQKEITSNNSEKSQVNESKSEIKQIRSARPDMTRAKGARPQSVIRQPGSVMPKGIGRPGGIGGAGRR